MPVKKILSRAIDIVLICIVGFFLWQRFPFWQKQNSFEGSNAPQFEAKKWNGSSWEDLVLPLVDSQPSVLVFWATWCGPCKVELSRIQDAINSNELPKDRIFAISLGESSETVARHAKEKAYTFQILLDSSNLVSQLYPVPGTPTVVHLDKNQKVVWIGTGISPSGIIRAKKLFE